METTALCLIFTVTLPVCLALPAARILPDSPDPLVKLQAESSRGLPKPSEERTSDDTAFEFDMLLTPLQKFFIQVNSRGNVHNDVMALKRKAINDGTRLWPRGIIPYEIDSALSPFEVKWAVDAMTQWQQNTCLLFKPRSPDLEKQLDHDGYIRLTRGDSCSTQVGRVPGGQNVTIGSCDKGSIIHELGHTIGYVHEQSRPDRDFNVDIILANIIPSKDKDFIKYTNRMVNSYGLPYDFGSIMHYGSTAYSKNGGITVRTHDPHVQMVIGQRLNPSFLDIKLANEVYHCSDHCKQARVCNNGGYLGPDCRCVCPSGLTGHSCEQVLISKSGCGGIYTADSGTVQTPDFPTGYPQDEDCFWLIQGPPSSSITVTFESFDTDNEEDCQWCTCDYLEVKKYGMSKVGQRYCGSFVKNPIVHDTSSLMLQFHTDDVWSTNNGIKFSYQILHS